MRRTISHLRLIEQYPLPRLNRRPLRVDGVIVDSFMLRLGVWEAKDNQDDLQREIPKKFAAGYPKDNILFQSPERLILWQNGRETFDVDMRQPEALIEGLQQFSVISRLLMRNGRKPLLVSKAKCRSWGKRCWRLLPRSGLKIRDSWRRLRDFFNYAAMR
ncbi:MAG: hypothetical protein IPL59_06660 [Candidatus Competibacteraceae bacterium]|nr:hypothetical protein [Candidatus Competibacteraceae bacterium]